MIKKNHSNRIYQVFLNSCKLKIELKGRRAGFTAPYPTQADEYRAFVWAV